MCTALLRLTSLAMLEMQMIVFKSHNQQYKHPSWFGWGQTGKKCTWSHGLLVRVTQLTDSTSASKGSTERKKGHVTPLYCFPVVNKKLTKLPE